MLPSGRSTHPYTRSLVNDETKDYRRCGLDAIGHNGPACNEARCHNARANEAPGMVSSVGSLHGTPGRNGLTGDDRRSDCAHSDVPKGLPWRRRAHLTSVERIPKDSRGSATDSCERSFLEKRCVIVRSLTFGLIAASVPFGFVMFKNAIFADFHRWESRR